MVWVRRIGYAFEGLLVLVLAGAGWVWYAKPWFPKAELIRYSQLYVLGGSNKGTNAALTDSWARTRAFLSEALQPAPQPQPPN